MTKESKRGRFPKYLWLSMTVEKTLCGWWAIDWDYEGDDKAYGPFRTESECQRFVERREFGE